MISSPHDSYSLEILLNIPLVVNDDTFVEADVPEQPVAATAMDKAPADAFTDVEQPRHAVVKFIVNCHCYSFYMNLC